MKIWKAELILQNEKIFFNFEKQEFNYKNNEYNENEWIYFEDWMHFRIQKNIAIDRTMSGNLRVQQGFDHELNKDELKKLKIDMLDVLKAKLSFEKQIYIDKFNNNIRMIEDEEEKVQNDL